MNATSGPESTDRECLKAFARNGGAEALRSVVTRYLPLVYSTALRRLGNPPDAANAARAVFLVLARRARKLGRRTVLAAWLFHVTAITSRKLKRKHPRAWRWFGWFRRNPAQDPASDANPWDRIARHLDATLDRLPSRQRNPMLLLVLLNSGWETAGAILRTSERRARKRAERGLKKTAKRLRRFGVNVDADTLAAICSANACAAALPEGLADGILTAIDETKGGRPAMTLARRTLATLAWARWRRRLAVGAGSGALFLALAGGAAWYVDSLSGHSRSLALFLEWSVRRAAKEVPGLAQPAKAWPADEAAARLHAASIRDAASLYRTTNIWLAHLQFSREQWKALEPERIAPLPHFLRSDGTVLLRNPNAQRSGLAGVLGFDFNWARGDFQFGGVPFTNVAVRFKGNGTYLMSLYGPKRAFKVDLNRFAKGQKLAGVDELNFHNLVEDRSCISDALGYEFFRDAGVPAPRTAFAWLTVSVGKQWDRKPLGLYALVETVDEEFAAERFGSKAAPIFKPVTLDLFQHLGNDWTAYEAVYDLKTKATSAQRQRIIDFARLVSHADDREFAARAGEFLDLDNFARFLAGEVLLSSYDSMLCNGQNFFIFLHPRSNRIGFIPWDLDHAWGGFYLLASRRELERASIWHPWVGENRFLERVMGVEDFRKLYRAHLEDFHARLFAPERLHRRIDDLAALIREPVAAESDFRLRKFEQAVGDAPLENSGRSRSHADRPAHQLKRFIEARARSVRRQLDGESEGVILRRRARD